MCLHLHRQANTIDMDTQTHRDFLQAKLLTSDARRCHTSSRLAQGWVLIRVNVQEIEPKVGGGRSFVRVLDESFKGAAI